MDSEHVPLKWALAVTLMIVGLIFAVFGWVDMQDARKLEQRQEVCAAAAETIEGFRRCTGVK